MYNINQWTYCVISGNISLLLVPTVCYIFLGPDKSVYEYEYNVDTNLTMNLIEVLRKVENVLPG